MVTDVISTNKKGDHLPVGFKIDTLYMKEESELDVMVLKCLASGAFILYIFFSS